MRRECLPRNLPRAPIASAKGRASVFLRGQCVEKYHGNWSHRGKYPPQNIPPVFHGETSSRTHRFTSHASLLSIGAAVFLRGRNGAARALFCVEISLERALFSFFCASTQAGLCGDTSRIWVSSATQTDAGAGSCRTRHVSPIASPRPRRAI